MRHFVIAKNTFYQAFARAITSLIGFLITVIIARQFGVLGFGDFTKVTSYVALFYLIVDFGLNAFYIQHEKPNFKNLFYLRLSISFFIFLLLNTIAFFLPYNSWLNSGFSESVKLGIFIFSFSLFSQSMILSASAVFQKSINYFSYMIGVVLGALVNLLVIFILAFLNFSILYIFIAFVLSSFLSALILVKLTGERILPPSLDINFAKKILLKSLPISLMLIFNLVYFRADMFLLSLLASTKDVGIYGLSYKFFDFLIALPLFLSNAVYPFLIKVKNDEQKFVNLVKDYFFVFLAASFMVILPFWFISPFFTLVKPDFASSIIPFRILLLSLPFFYLTSFFQWVLITKEKQKYLMYIYLFSTVLNVGLNIIFIPSYSYIGAAIITVFSEGLVFIFLTAKIFSLKKFVKERSADNG